MKTSNILKEPSLICQAPPGKIIHSPPDQKPLAHRNAPLSILPGNRGKKVPGDSRELYSYGVPTSRKILTCELYISNCYRLDKLILCLVRWLLEHGSRYLNLNKLARELYDALHGANFWRLIWSAKADLSKATPILNQEGGTT